MWEREAHAKSEAYLEQERASRIANLDAQRASETDAARAREAEWRAADLERTAAEVAKRDAELARREAEAAELVAKAKAEQAQKDAAMSAEQKRLADERERQQQLEKAKNAPGLKRQVSEDFAYSFEAGMEAKVKAFRQRGTGGDAIIMRIDHEQGMLLIDEQVRVWCVRVRRVCVFVWGGAGGRLRRSNRPHASRCPPPRAALPAPHSPQLRLWM